MLYSEHQKRLAGKPPRRVSYLDEILLMHCKPDGTFCGKMKPPERWYGPAHLKARREGLIKAGALKISLFGGKGQHFWFLTDKGKEAAKQAKMRKKQYDEALAAWAEKVRDARRLWKEQGA